MSSKAKVRRVDEWIVLPLAVLALLVLGCGRPSDDTQANNQQQGDVPWDDSGTGPVTRVYGPAQIRVGSSHAESKIKPWSAYWFPPMDDALYDANGSNPAPLQKYDTWSAKAKKVTSHAADYEKRLQDAGEFGDGYAGLTSAWSKAAVMEPEPTKAVTSNGVKFEVFDLKALLIKSYENAQGFVDYGSPDVDGQPEDDSQTLFPDQFHRFLQAELFEKGKPFIMDREPGSQIWQVPVFKADVEILKDPNRSDLMHVHATIGTAGTRDDYGFVGTSVVSYDYYYDLSGTPLANGMFLVKSGAWTGPSVENHPGFVTSAPDKSVHHSSNPEIRSDFVDEILKLAP